MAIPRCGTEDSFYILDGLRSSTLHVNATDAAFTLIFQRLISNLLAGLDWTKVLVAGGITLATFIHIDPNTDAQVVSYNIDLYLYGLSS